MLHFTEMENEKGAGTFLLLAQALCEQGLCVLIDWALLRHLQIAN